VRDLAVALDRGELFGRRRAVRQPHLHVAAEDRLGVGRDAGDRGGADRADAGDRRDAKDQACDEQAEPVRARAQLAPGEAEGEEEGGHARTLSAHHSSSWSDLVRPSTSSDGRGSVIAGKLVDGRAKRDHDGRESSA
jgi:hypothetical protein